MTERTGRPSKKKVTSALLDECTSFLHLMSTKALSSETYITTVLLKEGSLKEIRTYQNLKLLFLSFLDALRKKNSFLAPLRVKMANVK